MEDNLDWTLISKSFDPKDNRILIDKKKYEEAIEAYSQLEWLENTRPELYEELKAEERLKYVASLEEKHSSGQPKSIANFAYEGEKVDVSIYTSGNISALNILTIYLIFSIAEKVDSYVYIEKYKMNETLKHNLTKEDAIALMQKLRVSDNSKNNNPDESRSAEILKYFRDSAELLKMQIEFENPGKTLKYDISGAKGLDNLIKNIKVGLNSTGSVPDFIPAVKQSIAAFLGEIILNNSKAFAWKAEARPTGAIYFLEKNDGTKIMPSEIVEKAINSSIDTYVSDFIKKYL